MIECEAKIRKWGNSLGIVLPKKCVEKGRISPDDKVKVVITAVDKKGSASRLWAKLPLWKAKSEELEKFVDKEFDIHV